MTKPASLRYRDKHVTREEHPDHQANCDVGSNPGASENEEFNDLFKAELNLINEKAGAAFNEERGLTDYDAGEREEILSTYAKALDGMDLSHNDKLRRAQELTAEVFKPVQQAVEVAEVVAQANLGIEAAQGFGTETAKFVMYLDSGRYTEGNTLRHDEVRDLKFNPQNLIEAQRPIDLIPNPPKEGVGSAS